MSSAEPAAAALNGLLVVDAQIHIWHNEDARHPWRPEWRTYAHRGGVSPTAEEVIAEMDRNGVGRAVLVPPSFTGDDNSASIEAASRFPDRFAVMGRISLDGPERPDLTQWRSVPGMLGIRLTFHYGKAAGWLEDGTADWLWRAAEEAGVPVMAFTPERVRHLAPVAERFPGLRLVIDHAGLPTSPAPVPMEALVEEAAGLARFPNVAVKASAFPCAAAEPFPFPTAQRCVRRLVDAFGADRVFWGSDLTRLPCSYGEAVRYVAEAGGPGLSRKELELVMGQGIVRWLGWDAG